MQEIDKQLHSILKQEQFIQLNIQQQQRSQSLSLDL